MFTSISDWAPIAGADQRKVTPSKGLGALKNVGTPMTGYGLMGHDKMTFPKGLTAENIEIGTMEPQRAGNRPSHLAPCIINGVQTFINPMFFFRQKRENNRNVPVYPAWVKLGDAERVMAQLLKQGGIEAGDEFEVQVADFEQDGSAKYIPETDENGNQILNPDGSVKRVRATRPQNFPTLPDPVL